MRQRLDGDDEIDATRHECLERKIVIAKMETAAVRHTAASRFAGSPRLLHATQRQTVVFPAETRVQVKDGPAHAATGIDDARRAQSANRAQDALVVHVRGCDVFAPRLEQTMDRERCETATVPDKLNELVEAREPVVVLADRGISAGRAHVEWSLSTTSTTSEVQT